METVKIYRHMYDNDKDTDGKDKPNELLGTFEIEDWQKDYSFEYEGVRKEIQNSWTGDFVSSRPI